MNIPAIFNELDIAVVMGGPGSEREVSLASGRAVLGALEKLGLRAFGVELTEPSIEAIPEYTGLVFNLIHGTFGEDGSLQHLLDKAGIAYTGAGADASRLAFDKSLAKRALIQAGVSTPKAEVLDVGSNPDAQPSMPVPFVVKPPREGSSVGIQIVHNQQEVSGALAAAARYSRDLLIEQYIAGPELTVAILGEEALPIVHIIPPEGVYDLATKYPWLSGKKTCSQYICPAALDRATTARVQELALSAHRALGIEIYSRVDVLLDQATGTPYVLEANTIPGMTETSLLPMAAAAAGISFPELCVRIAEASLVLRKKS